MHLAPLIRDLAVILGVAGLMALLCEKLRQPVVLGYILAGILIGPYTPPFQLITDVPSIQTWAELGVIFLMFTLGLEFSFHKLTRVGGSAAITALTEVLILIPAGYFVGKILGWSSLESLFLGTMISISSTTIIIKALKDLNLKNHRFAELIFAVLIVEDLFAILLLVALGTIAVHQTVSAIALLIAAFKLILVIGGWFIAGYFVVPRFIRYVGRIGNDEMLTLLSLGLCLALVVFANYFHYSTALGAFIMGSILAESPMLPRIEKNMTSLRDLFGAIFFVSIGMLIDPRILWDYKGTVLILCALTIGGKILSTSLGALVSGQSLKNSIQVGFGLAQIGEFSFIIAQLGVSLKVTSEFIYPIIVAVSLVTTFTTPYFIRCSGNVSNRIERWLPLRLKIFLNQYASDAEARRASSYHRDLLLRPFLRWSLNGLTASVLFVLCSEWLLPILQLKIGLNARPVLLLGWCVALFISAPFLWAMLTSFRSSAVLLRVASKLLTLFWIGTLSAAFFPGKDVFLVNAIALLIAFLFFYRRLERTYRWLEHHFLSTFEMQGEGQTSNTTTLKHLAPWDAHLIKMEIHPNSQLIMKTISEAALRVRYGVNIVAIQRGRKSIVTPLPQEILLPMDHLILLGTDDQVESMKKALEEIIESSDHQELTSQYELRQVRLSKDCPFVGQSIRQSGIREQFHAMVVGIERTGMRKINPDSDLLLLEEDVLWIAGEKIKLNQLMIILKNTEK